MAQHVAGTRAGGMQWVRTVNALIGVGLLVLTPLVVAPRWGQMRGVARAQEADAPPALTSTAPLMGPVLPAAPVRVHPGADLQIDDFYVHIPPGATEPLEPILVLHGMGGAGREFGEMIRARSDAERWVIVAPTFRYGDWRDPAVLTAESRVHFLRINEFLDRLPSIAGMTVQPHAFVYGFSRGAQAANRYALVYPERVAGVAMMSAGTYTLPLSSFPSGEGEQPLPFPYGVADMGEIFNRPFDGAAFARIPFWVGVGGRDNDPVDVPRQWDAYVGTNRVERAERFTQWLRAAGVRSELRVFAGTGHSLAPEVLAASLDFIAAHD